MAVHWFWNCFEEPCILVDAHAPGMGRDPLFGTAPVPLFSDGEDPPVDGESRIVSVDDTFVRAAEVERRVLDRLGSINLNTG